MPATPTHVQQVTSCAFTGGGDPFLANFGAAPTYGNWMVACGFSSVSMPTVADGWEELDSVTTYAFGPNYGGNCILAVKKAGFSESTTQKPFNYTGGTAPGLGAPEHSGFGGVGDDGTHGTWQAGCEIVEVANMPAVFLDAFQGNQWNQPSSAYVEMITKPMVAITSMTTESDNTLAYAFGNWWTAASESGDALSLVGGEGWTGIVTGGNIDFSLSGSGGGNFELIGHQVVPVGGSAVTAHFHGDNWWGGLTGCMVLLGVKPVVTIPIIDTTVNVPGVLFPYDPDWTQAVKITREFKTDIITSRSAREQRRALRDTPRKNLTERVTTFRSATSTLQAWLVSSQALVAYVPDVTRKVFTVADLPNAGTSVDVGVTLPEWLVDGVPLILENDGEYALVTLQSIAGTVLTFEFAVTQDWPIGTRITPALMGHMKGDLQSVRPTDNTMQLSVDFDVFPGSETGIAPPVAPATFNDRELVLFRPNWKDPVNLNHQHPTESLDYGQGPVAYYQPQAYAERVFKAVFLGLSPAKMELIEDWFERAKGQRGEFYWPTFEVDMILRDDIASTDTNFRVLGEDIFNVYATDTVFKAVMFQMNDGTQHFFKISNITLAVGGGGDNYSAMQLGAAIGLTIAKSDVNYVCWLPVWRFATDIMASEWLTDGVCQAQLTLRTLEDLNPDV